MGKLQARSNQQASSELSSRLRDITPMIENQMEKNMENTMKTSIIRIYKYRIIVLLSLDS